MIEAECTYPPRDWVPVDASATDVDLVDALGFIARSIRANTAGDVIFRCADTPGAAPDRTMTLAAGERVDGFFTHIKAGSTELHVAK